MEEAADKLVYFSQLRKFVAEWATEFASKPNQMNSAQADTFLRCMMAEKAVEAEGSLPPEVEADFAYQLIRKRCEAYGVEYSRMGLLFLTTLADRPGTLVMYAAALKGLGQNADTHGIANAFPLGFPNEEHLYAMWQKQKAKEAGFGGNPGMNVLDALRKDIWEVI